MAPCTTSKDPRKIIERHIWAHHVGEADHLRHQSDMKQIYARRKETIERVFADAYFCCYAFEEAPYWTWQSPKTEENS